MSSRKYDFVILGATGFTGQFVAEEVSFLFKSNLSFVNYTFLIYGKRK